MPVQLCLLPGAIPEMFAQISNSGVITLADRYGLLAALTVGGIDEEERLSIDRILRAVCRGRLKLIDELSFLA
jgi:hypothetical protein